MSRKYLQLSLIHISYLTFFQNHIVSVYAAAQTEQKEDSSVQILQENLMEEIQIDDVQKMLDEIMDDHVFSVREALMNIINLSLIHIYWKV